MTYSLIRFTRLGSETEQTGVLADGRVHPLQARINDLVQNWATWQATVEQLIAEPAGDTIDLDDVRLLSPVQPQQIIQAGANYRTHVIDLAVSHKEENQSEEEVREQTARMMDKRSQEGLPYFFIGLPTAIAAPNDELSLPYYSQSHDWELELAAVIGKRTHRVSVEEALEHVFGYTMVNDITTRDLVFRKDMPAIGSDWYRAKNAPGFFPTGPLLVPAQFISDPQQLTVTLKLNGQVMQQESTADMIFTVAQLISHASWNMPLLPGDLVLTGSPAGNGAHWGRLLRDGDVMEGSITSLGMQTVACRDEVRV
ncbi:fumarylacetoacetate hydrolase family protein [Glutamicibacter sp. NPDC087344]|uniref:fumarylacetoacetate hydrolase family protein n=1 Tax=Glutamicibacter sp. NPDC087344 TaxID=3363994 RepID=UPI00382F376C